MKKNFAKKDHYSDEKEKIITIITFGYPNSLTPSSYVFVENLVSQWRKMGYKIKVINPIPKRKQKKVKIQGFNEDDCFPMYNDYLWIRNVLGLKKVQMYFMYRSIFKKVKLCFDFNTNYIYSHFLNSGFIASKLSKITGIKSFCAFAESSLWSLNDRRRKSCLFDLNRISGFISVSKKNTQILIKEKICEFDKILTIPNGVDFNVFYKTDKKEMRRKMGIDQGAFIGIFVGHFIYRKGLLRVDQAARDIPNLKMIYVGSGPEQPSGSNIIFKGVVKNNELREYMAVADFFILPTLAEGCCNAILEAMACGLPIITSNCDFNKEILNEQCAIFVDPLDINQLRTAIKTLKDNEILRNQMATIAEIKSKNYNIEDRAKIILEFIKNQ